MYFRDKPYKSGSEVHACDFTPVSVKLFVTYILIVFRFSGNFTAINWMIKGHLVLFYV
jgi:hypothetical protein